MTANRMIARLFLPSTKRLDGTTDVARHGKTARKTWNGQCRQESNLAPEGICTGCDSGPDPGQKLALSRTAQRDLFALCVLAL
jgi:hypothetical protein